ncbi:MAG: UDP-N-acetylmuramate--L-alanine ligase [Epsilonproteobacteria bacterium]|nr:UDP-N-acetylmuramate--L-alanine ligase [Campylobacterota bacterium]
MKIHFIGIGGIGLSGIARLLKSYGHIISGSDIARTTLTDKLQEEGIKVNIPHTKEAIKDQDLVIYTAVVKDDNPELLEARKRGIKTLSRREALNLIVNDKKVYSVCGAHGKSTTSAILASILQNANALIGAESKDFKSNFRASNSDILVFEADESDGSFVDSNPYCAIVTNAEPEHMEFYNYDYDLFYKHYEDFINKAKKQVLCSDDEFLAKQKGDKVSIDDISNIEYKLIDNLPKTTFKFLDETFEVYGFGEHIVLDTALAIKSALNEISIDEIKQNLKKYQGIKKRFDILQNYEDFVVIDDYGHHPTEIKATLQSAFKFANLKNINKVIAIWQPHKYSRTIDNLDSFIECFEGVDELVILPVWSAGEDKQDIDFKTLFKRYNPTFANKIKTSNKEILINDKIYKEGLIIGFGAGDITYQLRGLV